MHKISDEFELRPDQTAELAAIERQKNPIDL